MSKALDWFAGQPLQVAIIMVAAVVARWLLSRLITRLTARVVAMRVRGEDHGDSRGVRARKRATSITSLLNRVVSTVIWALATVMALSVFGINIAPIVASAGVIGVALGFGAQELVKDYIAGIFITLEDQYGAGDTIDIGDVRGEVEDVGLRVTRVRGEDGVIWYVRNGQIIKVGNRTQGGAS